MDADGSIAGGTIAIRLAIVLLLVALNAGFVAAEYAVVALRGHEPDDAEGATGARRTGRGTARRRTPAELDRQLSGTQLGITLASLALGWVGAPAVAALLGALLQAAGLPAPAAGALRAVGLVLGFLLVACLHVVLGELVPKAIAARQPERVGRWVAVPLLRFSRLLAPLITALDLAARAILRLLGITAETGRRGGRSPDELRRMMLHARAQGLLDESDSAMVAGVLHFHTKKVRDVMRPRTEVVALELEASQEEVWETVRAERYSRYPVYRDSLDDVAGVVLAKDLWLYEGGAPFRLADFLRPPLLVPDSRPAELVLGDLRTTRAQMAIVLDEHGGTAGIVTMEDLVEEVIGEIADEHDPASRLAMEMDGVLELAASLSLADVRDEYGVPIPEGDWTTLGGYVFSKLGRLPRVGDRVGFPSGELEVVAIDGRRVAAVRVLRMTPVSSVAVPSSRAS